MCQLDNLQTACTPKGWGDKCLTGAVSVAMATMAVLMGNLPTSPEALETTYAWATVVLTISSRMGDIEGYAVLLPVL